MKEKSFITLTPGVSVTKMLFFVTTEEENKARVFVLGKPFQQYLIFAGKVRSLPHLIC